MAALAALSPVPEGNAKAELPPVAMQDVISAEALAIQADLQKTIDEADETVVRVSVDASKPLSMDLQSVYARFRRRISRKKLPKEVNDKLAQPGGQKHLFTFFRDCGEDVEQVPQKHIGVFKGSELLWTRCCLVV